MTPKAMINKSAWKALSIAGALMLLAAPGMVFLKKSASHQSPLIFTPPPTKPIAKTNPTFRLVKTPADAEPTGSEALRAAQTETDPLRRGELLRRWAASVPLEAMERTINNVPFCIEPQMQSDARFALVSQWSLDDPRDAANALLLHAKAPSSLPNGNLEWVNLLDGVMAQWTGTDAPSAMIWGLSLPDGSIKSEVLGQAENQVRKEVAKLAPKDPPAAAAYLAHLPADGVPLQSVTSVVSAWASEAPMETANWVSRFPENSLRVSAMEQLMSTWTASDANQAAQWLKNLPESPSRDSAVTTLSRTLGPAAPDAAFYWAETISDEAIRNRQLENVARVWLQKDSAAAQIGIQQSDLPNQVKARLLGH